MKLGIMLYNNGEKSSLNNRYELALKTAEFADRNGFSGFWLPERHFSPSGGLYPNPAVLYAAIAGATETIKLRTGSVVLPLHDPLRVAEEWSMVDNLSNGRVELGVASGWHPDDFVFYPDRYAGRRDGVFEGIEKIRDLWSGKSIPVVSATGSEIKVGTYPRPVQSELPVWIAAVGSPDTFKKAGEIGANILTHLFAQEISELAEKIAIYREARLSAGLDPSSGKVAVMLHTHIGDSEENVRNEVRKPYCDYLKENGSSFLRGVASSQGSDIDVDKLSSAELDEFAEFVFERFYSSRSLMGTPENCLGILEDLAEVGTDEVACLIDFGQDDQLILDRLPDLNALRTRAAEIKGRSPEEVQFLPASEKQKAEQKPSFTVADSLDLARKTCPERRCVVELYHQIATAGGDWGKSYRVIRNLWRGDDQALAEIELSVSTSDDLVDYQIHPVLWDNCYQLMGSIILDELIENSDNFILLQLGYDKVVVHRPSPSKIWCHFVLQKRNKEERTYSGDFRIFDEEGNPVADVRGIQSQQVLTKQAEPRVARAPAYDGNLTSYIESAVRTTIGLKDETLDTREPLLNLGLDSIMAIGLRSRLEIDLGIVIPIVRFLKGISTKELLSEAELLMEEVDSNFDEAGLQSDEEEFLI